MSAIGDYIHLTYQGYKDPQQKHQGTIPFEYTGSMIKESDAIGVFMGQRDKMKKLIAQRGSEEIAQKIQKQIRDLQGVSMDNTKARLFYGYLLNAIEENLDIQLRDNLQALPAKGAPEGDIQRVKRALNNIKKVNNEKVSKGGVSLEQTLIPFAKGITSLMEQLEHQIIDTKKIDELEEAKQKIKDYIKSFVDQINEKNNQSQRDGKTRTIIQIKNRVDDDKNKKSDEVIQIVSSTQKESIGILDFALIVDDLIKKISYETSEKQGAAAELVVATAAAKAYGIASENIDKNFLEMVKKNLVVGGKKGQIYFDPSDYAQAINNEIGEGYSINNKSGVVISNLASSDKVDVKFYLNEDPITPLNLSVKNYLRETVKKFGFGGVSGSPLLNLVTQMNNNDFVNHWINSTIVHSKDFDNLEEEMLGKYWSVAHDLMKYSLVVLGVIGGGKKMYNGEINTSDTADYLVWNNASGAKTQGMVVYPIKTLLEKLYNEIVIAESNKKWVEGYDENFLANKEWSTIKMLSMAKTTYNKTVPQIRKRINIALVKMFQAKISTHLFLSDELLSRMET